MNHIILNIPQKYFTHFRAVMWIRLCCNADQEKNFLNLIFNTFLQISDNFFPWQRSRRLRQWSRVRIRHLSQWNTLRTSRVTVYTVKSRGREGDLPPEAKKKIEKRQKKLPSGPGSLIMPIWIHVTACIASNKNNFHKGLIVEIFP